MDGADEALRPPSRLGATLGGPSTVAGVLYQGLIAQVETLRLLPQAWCGESRYRLVMERRVIVVDRTRQVGFDLRVVGEDDQLFEIKLDPTADDIAAWISNVRHATSKEPPTTRFVLVHGKESRGTKALASLVLIAGESETDGEFHERLPRDGKVDSLVVLLGPTPRQTLRRMVVVHRPIDAERRLAETLARHLCIDRGRGVALLRHLESIITEAGARRAVLDLQAVHADLITMGYLLERQRDLPRDLEADALERANHRCCICRREDVPVTVYFINGMRSDHEPANLAVLCATCREDSQRAAVVTPALEIERLAKHQQGWDWRVAQMRRARNASAVGRQRVKPGESDLVELLRSHLIADFHWTGPHKGEFARLGGRMEDRFYQSNSGERLTARPAYYHTYWGLVASELILPELFPVHAEAARDAIAARLAATGWVTVELQDYVASPVNRVRQVETIRHTARAAAILLLVDGDCPLITDVAWNLLSEWSMHTNVDGGWHEFRGTGDAHSSLYSSLYVLHLLGSIISHERFTTLIPEPERFKAKASEIIDSTWNYLWTEWNNDRWSLNGMPWQVNAPPILADIARFIPLTHAARIYDDLRALFSPSGRLVEPTIGADWDAPPDILALRVAYALTSLLSCAPLGTDERMVTVSSRLFEVRWENIPLRTMDASFLVQLYEQGLARIIHGAD
jgi:hypothetical protein